MSHFRWCILWYYVTAHQNTLPALREKTLMSQRGPPRRLTWRRTVWRLNEDVFSWIFMLQRVNLHCLVCFFFFYLFNVARKWIIYSHPQRMSSIFLKAYIITLIVIITMITNVSSSIVSRSHPCCQWLRSNTFILHLWEICHLTVCGPHEASYLTCCVVFSNNAVWSSTWRCCSGLLYTVWSSAEHKLLTDYRIYCVSFL